MREPEAAQYRDGRGRRSSHEHPPLKELPRELLVLQPVRNDAVGAEPAHLVLLVILEIGLEPLDMAVPFEGEDVRRDAVEEPAAMADDDAIVAIARARETP